MENGAEFRPRGRFPGAQLSQTPIRLMQHIGQKFGGDVERHRSDFDPVRHRGLNQFSRKTGLGQEDPDRRHRWRTGTEVDRQRRRGRRAGSQFAQRLPRSPVDFAEVHRTGQDDRAHDQLGVGARPQPGQIALRPLGGIVAEQHDPGEIPERGGLRNGADARCSVVFSRFEVGGADPAHQYGFQGSDLSTPQGGGGIGRNRRVSNTRATIKASSARPSRGRLRSGPRMK